MILSIEKKDFIQGVQIVGRFVDKGSASLPVLGNILVVVSSEGIKFRGTNLETGIDRLVAGSHTGEGVVAIPARILEQLASVQVGEGVITLEQSGDTVLVKSGMARSSIKTMPYEDFPILPVPEQSKGTFSLTGAVLQQLLSSVASCASTSTVRPELASVYLSIEGGVCSVVSTDSFRLVEKKVALTEKTIPTKLLIPAKNALDIAQALPQEKVTVSFDEHQCTVSAPGLLLTTRLTSAAYPDYRQIIPKEVVAEATVLRKDLELALKRSMIFSDSFQKVKLSFDPKKKTLALSARNADVGEFDESIQGQVSGGAVEISFNHRYLMTFFSLTGAESVTLSVSGVGRPLSMRPVGDTTLLYLVMPMNQ